jgi:hypothetical protein
MNNAMLPLQPTRVRATVLSDTNYNKKAGAGQQMVCSSFAHLERSSFSRGVKYVEILFGNLQ